MFDIVMLAGKPANAARIEKLLIAVFCFSIPLGTRLALWHDGTRFFPYNTVFLYATDIVVALLAACWISQKALRGLFFFKTPAGLSAAVFLGIGVVSALYSAFPALGMAFLARLALFIFFAALLSSRLSHLPHTAFYVPIFLSGVLQAALSWFQFFSGHDAGLWFLGEQALGADIAGVAKLEVLGTTFVRAYGTFPHPNVLAAFLIFTAFLSGYAYTQRSEKSFLSNIAWMGGIALMLTGLLFTFSRSGWLAFSVGISIVGLHKLLGKKGWVAKSPASQILVSGPALWRGDPRKLKFDSLDLPEQRQRVRALGIVLVSVILFAWFYFPNEIQSRRNLALEDQAIQLRLEGTFWAAKMIDAEKFFGVGPGQFVQHIERHTATLQEPWMYQPVHNLYLLIASEFGLLGLLAFFVCIALMLRSWFQHRKSAEAPWSIAACAIFISFLVLGLFDHYFFTFEQGLTLFWISAALLYNANG